jgi:hypothetical protein
MKQLIPLFVLLISCNGSEATPEGIADIPSSQESVEIDVDSTLIEDRLDKVETNTNLLKLLENPIDLPAYKEKYGPSNSGGCKYEEKLFAIPDTIGLLYSYFLFHKLRRELPSHPSEGDLFNKFGITVYMYGETVGGFYDHNEELIMIECALDNPTLGELNWYGKDQKELQGEYGSPQFIDEDTWLYVHENNVISARFESSKLIWFKYVRLNKDINLEDEIPELLLTF